jgi:hypothetical protein
MKRAIGILAIALCLSSCTQIKTLFAGSSATITPTRLTAEVVIHGSGANPDILTVQWPLGTDLSQVQTHVSTLADGTKVVVSGTQLPPLSALSALAETNLGAPVIIPPIPTK